MLTRDGLIHPELREIALLYYLPITTQYSVSLPIKKLPPNEGNFGIKKKQNPDSRTWQNRIPRVKKQITVIVITHNISEVIFSKAY